MSEPRSPHADHGIETTAEFAAQQWREAKGPNPQVTCECGRSFPLRFTYRCLYCGMFLCQQCAEIHFGKTRDQHNLEQAKAAMTPQPDYVYLLQLSGPAPVRVLVTSVDDQTVTYHVETPEGYMLRQPGRTTTLQVFSRRATEVGRVLPVDLNF